MDRQGLCGDTTVTQTRTKTVYGWILADDGLTWVAADPVVTTEQGVRDLTADEIESCRPDDKIEYGDWTDGEWECGDTTVTQTRTKTVTTYVLDNGVWIAADPVVTTEQGVRDLTADEQFPCPTTTTTTTTVQNVVAPVDPFVTDPNCFEAGSVELAVSDDYSWVTNDDGTYTAVPEAGVVLEGQTVFGPYQLDQLTVGCNTEPPITTTTVLVGSEGPTTTLTQELPKTGGNGAGNTLTLGALLLAAGMAALIGTRRRAIG